MHLEIFCLEYGKSVQRWEQSLIVPVHYI